MVLGIVATTGDHPEYLTGLARAALERGHQVKVFLTDAGVQLSQNADVLSLQNLAGMEICLCLHSARQRNIQKESIAEGITCGSQYNNASMIRASDKVISL